MNGDIDCVTLIIKGRATEEAHLSRDWASSILSNSPPTKAPHAEMCPRPYVPIKPLMFHIDGFCPRCQIYHVIYPDPGISFCKKLFACQPNQSIVMESQHERSNCTRRD